MPCANTSTMPALRAKSMSMWIGLWSPEAPAKSASVVRLIGGSASGGSVSPTLMASKLSLLMSWVLLAVAMHEHAAQVGHVLAALVGDARLVHDELQRAALLVVDVGDVRPNCSVSPAYAMRWYLKILLAVQDAAEGRCPARRAKRSRGSGTPARTGRSAAAECQGGRRRGRRPRRCRWGWSRRWPSRRSAAAPSRPWPCSPAASCRCVSCRSCSRLRCRPLKPSCRG